MKIGGSLKCIVFSTPAPVSLEIRVEEDPLTSEAVPQGGEVAIGGPGKGRPGWTPLHLGGSAQPEAPVDL